ncbi:MAG: hypothetical protein HYY12_02565 [Candidatus Methylomirabilis oxyfera]|nr:hypothetical protein [Candidatus Methylomirabilis oxyfera]
MKRYVNLALLALTPAMVAFLVCSATTAAAKPLVVGIAQHGENVLELVGRSDQDGNNVTHYGYLTRIQGLPDEMLFSHPSIRTEATARFTFFATTALTARHVLGNIIATAALGTLTIYFNETPSGDFGNPGSFAAGTPIATFSARFHNVLNTQALNAGINSAVADLIQLGGDSFMLDGVRYRLGQRHVRERLSAHGQATRTQVDPPQSFFLWGGNVVIIKP